jgi:hypothetical protein
LNIVFDIIYSYLEWGFLSKSFYVGDSVERAKEAKVSIIKLIQSIWIGFNIYCFKIAAPTKVEQTATMFTVNWNWMNFLIES